MTDFLKYFKEISTSSKPNDIPPKSQEEGPMDAEISLEELKNACLLEDNCSKFDQWTVIYDLL